MGIGPFSSESTTRLDNRNTAYNTGFSEVEGAATSVNLDLGGKIKIGKGGSLAPVLQFTDQGAIAAAQSISEKSIRSVELLGSNLTSVIESIAGAIRGQGEDVIAAVTSANKSAIGAVSEANRTEIENIGLAAIKWGALALAAYLAARAVWSMAK